MYKSATKGQRFAALIIDILIFSIVSFIFVKVLNGIFSIEEPTESLNYIIDHISDTDFLDSDIYKEHMDLITDYSVKNMSVSLVVYLAVFSLYFVLLPLVWSKQTVGRLAMKIKLAKKDGSVLSTGDVIVRELVGNFLIGYVLNICCCIPGIVNIIMLASNNQTIADKISQNTIYVKTDEFEEPKTPMNYDDIYDAEIVDSDIVDGEEV